MNNPKSSRNHTESFSVLYQTVEELVEELGGEKKKVIKKILIANNGLSAVKCIRSLRSWAYETFSDEKAIEFVVMATPEDLQANAEYIRMADQVVEVPGGTNNFNYANVVKIVSIAEQMKVDAVWAGWGHASENPDLPTQLESKGIRFIGPPAGPMKALGDKIGSTIIAQTAQVPTVRWNGNGITLPSKDDMTIPTEIYEKASIHNTEEAIEAAEKIGYPVMIKASEGGGGKGIRLVTSKDQMETSYRQVVGEIPGSPIFIMKVCEESKHLEVQLLADLYDNCISLSGRDCSVQRRHQKIIEEGPPLAASPEEIWNEMTASAIRLAKLVHYQNVGTVEFLFTKDKKFYFLELNPRLQVEHPVTEMITNVNLPAAQLMVSMGIPLWAIPDIRKLYNKLPYPVSPIDFEHSQQYLKKGHVIACRITAENPDAGFQPTSGKLKELNFRTVPNVWGYFSIDSSGKIHEYADSQFGHLFAWGETRGKARRNMVYALKDITIRGDIRTTTEYLISLLESNEFKEYTVTTSWLDKRLQDNISSTGKLDNLLVIMVGAVCKTHKKTKEGRNEFVNYLQRGQVPPDELISILQNVELIYNNTKYKLTIHQSGIVDYTVECNGTFATLECRDLTDGGFLIMYNDKSHVAYLQESANGLRMILDSVTCLFTNEYDPTTLKSANAGKIARYLVESGSHVDKNKPYAEIEVMKMYMPLLCPEDGEITFILPEGSVISPGDEIGRLKLDDPSKVKHSEIYTGTLHDINENKYDIMNKRPHELLKKLETRIYAILDGYYISNEKLTTLISQFTDIVKNTFIPYMEYVDIMSVIKSRLPDKLVKKLKELASMCDNPEMFTYNKDGKIEIKPQVNTNNRQSSLTQGEFAARDIKEIIDKYLTKVESEQEKVEIKNTCKPLYELAERYQHGIGGLEITLYKNIFERYIEAEHVFLENLRLDEIINELKKEHENSVDGFMKIYDIMLSHKSLTIRNELVVKLLKNLPMIAHLEKSLTEFSNVLDKMAQLNDNRYAQVAMEARLLLMRLQMPNDDEIKEKIKSIFSEIINCGNNFTERNAKIKEILNLSEDMNNVLLSMMSYRNADYSSLAMEIYLRRIYSAYSLGSISKTDLGIPSLKFSFHSKSPNVPNAIPASDSIVNFQDLQSDTNSPSTPSTPSSTTNSLQLTGLDKISQEEYPALPEAVERQGVLIFVPDVTAIIENMDDVLNVIKSSELVSTPISTPTPSAPGDILQQQPIHVIHAITQYVDQLDDNETLPNEWSRYLENNREKLKSSRIRRITVTLPCDSKLLSFPRTYTYRHRYNYNEDIIVRHIEPPMAYHLELSRLLNFRIRLNPTPNRSIHMYIAEPKEKQLRGPITKRFFVRVVIRSIAQKSLYTKGDSVNCPEAERCFVEALNALELGITELMVKPDPKSVIDGNHIFINIIPDLESDADSFETLLADFYTRYASIIKRVRVTMVEIKANVRFSRESLLTSLFIATNPTGLAVKIDSYVETKMGGTTIYQSISNEVGEVELDGQKTSTPYPIKEPFEQQRAMAYKSSETVYCYDFIELIKKCLSKIWQNSMKYKPDLKPNNNRLLSAVELVLNDSGNELKEDYNRKIGDNTIGMVAWRITLYTPVYPTGRDIILICNDITKHAGSFGTKEDKFFSLATHYAVERKIPRIYFAANSGARIGLAEEVKGLFNVSWIDENNPIKGFEYLYLTPENYEKLQSTKSVICEKLVVNDEIRYVIKAIVGKDSDLGVENLRGSGTIAGDTSRAYEDIFTLTYVTGRSVGIGAYLVRLGQRTIQKDKSAPIILTGYGALNKLMGKTVYTSNNQLGGPSIMYNNGVSHLVVNNDLEGVEKVIEWLEFVPRMKDEKLIPYMLNDKIDREIEYEIPSIPCDPRLMLCGVESEDGFKSGFFDKNSFVETLCGWAKTVICGRGRLGGYPCGIIATENRTIDCIIPADPATPQSQEQIIHQAGGVWYPDSAFKTATAINDFNGENLPLFIFANWRGFSGGAHDMFEEILKYGSQIVDALVHYKSPIIMYLPPHSELRGGAWVVLDSTINSEMIEMYADSNSRGGVLEPAGTTEIKYRVNDILKTAHRLDKTLEEYDLKLKNNEINEEEKKLIIEKIKNREELLLTTYRHIAESFADLHDTPGRMYEKGVIKSIVDWKDARKYFYRHLIRRLSEFELRKKMMKADPSMNFCESGKILHGWFDSMENNSGDDVCVMWKNDEYVYKWFNEKESAINSRISGLRKKYLKKSVESNASEDTKITIDSLFDVVNHLNKDESEVSIVSIRNALRKRVTYH